MPDPWTPPAGATPEQFPHGRNPQDGTARLTEMLAEIRTELRDLPGHLLAQAGIRVEPGKLIIEGDLSVPNGVIKNDWLENPVLFDSTFGTDGNFAVPATSGPAEVAVATFVIPAGYTRMQFTMIGTCRVLNNSGSTQYVYLGAWRRTNGTTINGVMPQQIALPAGFSGTLSAPYIYTDDVAEGDSIEFFLTVSASTPLAADATVNVALTTVAISLTR